MVNLFIGIEIAAIVMLFVTLLLLLPGEGSKEHKLMVLFLSGSLVQNMGYLLELTAPTMEAAVVAAKIQYVGSIFVPLCYCWFIFIYCYQKAPIRLFQFLLAVDFGILLMVFTMNHHGLYYKKIEWLTADGGHQYMHLTYGPVYPVFLICGCMIPYLLSIYILIRAILSGKNQRDARNYSIFLLISILPIFALLAYAVKLTYVFDPTPGILGIVLSSVALLFWIRKNYDFRHLAAEEVLNSVGDGVIAVDDQMRLISYNKAAAVIFSDLAGHSTGDDVKHLKYFEEDMLDENVNKTFHFGSRYYESHTKQIKDKSGKFQGHVILVLDVTDTRNYIEEIKRVREQAERANTAKSEFLANMSHEIRTPMNAIIGLSDIITEESHGREIYNYANDIKSAARNLLAIINDILDLSKVEAGKMELVRTDYYLKSMVGEVVSMMDMAASQRGLLMKYDYDDQLPCMYHGDEGRIKQILINILNNAIKFTKKGYVRISVNGRPGRAEDTELLIFEIEDTGCGIRKEDLTKIFENFKQVNAKRNRHVEGTGLGLSITKQLVGLMGGNIEVESVYGKGTKFTVTLPQKIVDHRTIEETPDTSEQKAEKIETFTAKDCKMLVVDDNLVNRKVARGFLKPYQFDLSEASSGAEAIELVKKTKFDIIFMDHMMPEMDGFEAVQIIRRDCGENGTSPVIIALTANAMEGVKEKFLECGFQDYLSKPLDRKPLHEILTKWVPDRLKNYQEQQEEVTEEYFANFRDLRIAGVDIETAMRYHTGGIKDYEDILQVYVMDGERKLQLLKDIVEEKEYDAYQVEVHGLKSASANIGAMKLSSLAREHEEAAARGDIEFVNRHFPDLLSAYEKQLKHIQNFLEERKSAVEDEKEDIAIDRETLKEELKEALEMLKSFHSRECAEKIAELLKYHHDEEIREKLEEIQRQQKMYEDDKAEELIGELCRYLESDVQ